MIDKIALSVVLSVVIWAAIIAVMRITIGPFSVEQGGLHFIVATFDTPGPDFRSINPAPGRAISQGHRYWNFSFLILIPAMIATAVVVFFSQRALSRRRRHYY